MNLQIFLPIFSTGQQACFPSFTPWTPFSYICRQQVFVPREHIVTRGFGWILLHFEWFWGLGVQHAIVSMFKGMLTSVLLLGQVHFWKKYRKYMNNIIINNPPMIPLLNLGVIIFRAQPKTVLRLRPKHPRTSFFRSSV